MKTFILFLFLIFQTSISFAQDGGGEKGGSVGNGGDGDVGPSATKIAFHLAMGESNGQLVIVHHRDPQKLIIGPLLSKVKFMSTDNPIVMPDGMEVDAMNFPNEQKIIFNQVRWNRLSCKQKYSLVLHEILGVALIEASQNYYFSTIAIESYFAFQDDHSSLEDLCR